VAYIKIMPAKHGSLWQLIILILNSLGRIVSGTRKAFQSKNELTACATDSMRKIILLDK